MDVVDAKGFLFTLLKIKNGMESIDISIAEAEVRMTEEETQWVK